MKKNFYVTTPIYYTNGVPHIGHANSSFIADTIKRYKKISGFDTKFGTGVDENSQKAVLKAEEAGMEIMDYLDMMAGKHKAVWDGLKIEYTDFIRTTEKRHHDFVQKVLQVCFDKGDIYQGIYEGKYCIGCEGFKKDDDLIERDGKLICPDHLTEPENLKEKNYFFKLSKYQTWIEEFYNSSSNFVNPDFRYNEVKAFVKRGLEDFSVSRETNTFGITLPFDTNQVTYVWFDALFNYLTLCHTPDNGGDDTKFWPADLHVVGKDILRFHAIYWPAMLASYFNLGKEIDGVVHFQESDLEKLPTQILTTGYLTNEGQKISKSLGNVIDPVEFTSEKYNKELLILYLLSTINIGQDGDFSEKQAVLNYNAKLANNFGNLLNRAVVLTVKLGLENGLDGEVNSDLKDIYKNYSSNFISKMDEYNLKGALDLSFEVLDKINTFTTVKEPWKMMKQEGGLEDTINVLFTIAEGLRLVGMCLYSFFPEKMSEMFNSIALENYGEELKNGKFEELLDKKEVFNITKKSDILFQKFDI